MKAHNVESANRETVDAVPVSDRDIQRQQFGGLNIGSAFFGWLVAVSISTLLIGLLSAAGGVYALTADTNVDEALQNSDTIGVVGLIILLLVMALAYYAGGYVAGRMSRFDGARQGAGVWGISIVVSLLLSVVSAVLGAQYNVLQQLNLPSLPADGSDFTTVGIAGFVIVLLITLFAAIVGGKTGRRYHDWVDNAVVER